LKYILTTVLTKSFVRKEIIFENYYECLFSSAAVRLVYSSI